MVKIAALIVVLLVCMAPALYNRIQPTRDSSSAKDNIGREAEVRRREQAERMREYRRRHPPYKGPKTDERINRMMAECIVLMKGLGVPIAESIAPEVRLKGFRAAYGRCCPKGSLKNYTEYDYYIEISGFARNNTERSLRNTLIHELLHTVPGGLCHTGEWKKWATYVSAKTGYNIQRFDGDETEQDKKNLRAGCIE